MFDIKEKKRVYTIFFLVQVANDFQFGLYDLDFNIFGVHVQKAAELTPIMNEIGLKSHICGPESFTPDHKPLLGEDPRLGGTYSFLYFNQKKRS